MAKKLLINDDKLDWIKDTRSDNPDPTDILIHAEVKKPADSRKSADVIKPAAERDSVKEEKPSVAAAPSAVAAKKKNTKPETAAAVKAIRSSAKTTAVKKSQPKAAQKAASAPKRSLATMQSPAKTPSIKTLRNKPAEKKKTKTIRPDKNMIPPYHAARQPLEKYLSAYRAAAARTMPPSNPERLQEKQIIPAKASFLREEESKDRMEAPILPRKEAPAPAPTVKTSMTALSNLPETGTYNRILYLLFIAALISATVFLPERYSLFVFCGFLLIIIVEVSFRVAEHLRLLKMMKENRHSGMELLRKR